MKFLPQKILMSSDPKLEQLLNDMLAEMRSLKPRSSATARVNQTANGTSIEAIVPTVAGGASSGINYQGTYSTTKTYNVGDVVRVQSGASQGIWIRVANTTNPGPTTGVDPIFPEPSTTGGVNTWDMWAFGIQTDGVCAGGPKTQYINASPPV